jgi:pimeloyl-ACP methyl ester carboxylesterase
VPIIYPKFETRYELSKTVERFREWLQEKVIDLEVARGTPSPMVDPSCHVILVGHSMGGIVAAETYLLLASEHPVTAASSAMNPETPNFPSNTTMASQTGSSRPNPVPTNQSRRPVVQMFPYVRGILAFDTPFLGLSPGMIASQVEGGTQMASTAYKTYNEAAKIFGWGSSPAGTTAPSSTAKALPAPATSALDDAAAAPKWQSWGKVAMFAGAAGAVAAGGAAALYSQRERIGAGWTWASSHLLFIGDLGRPEHLKRRVENLEKATDERGARCANLYTNLGRGKREGTVTAEGGKRTFCNLPNKVNAAAQGSSKDVGGGGGGSGRDTSKSSDSAGMVWQEAINDKAKDEITAHCSMFTPRDNPGFYALGEKAKSFVVDLVDGEWYASSSSGESQKKSTDHHHQGVAQQQEEGKFELGDGEGWEKPDAEGEEDHDQDRWEGLDGAVEDEVRMTESYEGSKRQSLPGHGTYGTGVETEDLEDSVIVDKAAHKEVPLSSDQNPWAKA